MERKTKAVKRKTLLFVSLALAVFIFIALTAFWFWRSTGFSEENVRAYVREYIESRPYWKSQEPVVQDAKIEQMQLHDQKLSTAKVKLRLRGDFETWKSLYLVSSPDGREYLISDDESLLNEADRDGYAQVSAQTVSPTPAPTSTVIYREFPAPSKAP